MSAQTFPADISNPIIITEKLPNPMSKFKLSVASVTRLAGVHPSMRAIVMCAIELTEIDFVVTAGLRTRDDQMRLYGQGRTAQQMTAAKLNPSYARPTLPKVTWTMNSNHLSGRAVDLVPYVNGKIEWDNDGKLGLWQKLNKAMQAAAKELKTPIMWGGDWKQTIDRPHWELAG